MFSLKAKTDIKISAGITISDEGIAVAIVDRKQTRPFLKYAQFYPCSPSEHAAQLSQITKQHHLDTIPCNLVLNPDEYQILQVDAPEVPKQEMATALRWHIKDLINFHIDDVVLDHIELPIENISGKQPIQVIASRESLIKSHVDLLLAAHCKLNTIDIAALSARNIIKNLNLTDNYDDGIGLLNLWNETSRINVLLHDDLYINRTSDIGLKTLAFVSDDINSQSIIDTLALEIQRTFDYYESHARQAVIRQLFILSNGSDITNLAELLHQRLGIDCSTISLTDFISLYTNDDVPNACFMAIGGALRVEN